MRRLKLALDLGAEHESTVDTRTGHGWLGYRERAQIDYEDGGVASLYARKGMLLVKSCEKAKTAVRGPIRDPKVELHFHPTEIRRHPVGAKTAFTTLYGIQP